MGVLEDRQKSLLQYVSEGASNEDLLAAGYTDKEIKDFSSKTTPLDPSITPVKGEGTVEPYTPTKRETLKTGLKTLLEKAGAPKGSAESISEGALGSEIPTDKSSGMGLVDLTPLGAFMGLDEAGDKVSSGIKSGDKGQIASGALEGGLSALGLLPGGKLVGEGAKQASSKVVKFLTKFANEEKALADVVEAVPKKLITPADLDYNATVRKPTSLLDRDRVLPDDNILYRPDRGYRFIGQEGFDDFTKAGKIQAKQGVKGQYEVPYFMKGKTSSRYAGKGGDKYVVEAVPEQSSWKSAGGSFEESPYIGPVKELTAESPIRIFEKSPDGGYKVIFDNIKDEALLPATPQKFAKGGIVEPVDPVSGNAIPPGSLPKEVRDDVPIKASEGEYVLPADVVKYFGLDYIEKLIGKAKAGMEELQANGRIGGSGPDDLPFTPEELQAHEAELETTETPAEPAPAPAGMAIGGFVSPLQNGVSGPVASSVTPAPQPGQTSAIMPSWMTDPEKPLQGVPVSNNEGAGRGSTAEATGFGRAVGDWETKDYSDYAASKSNPVRGIADKVFSTVSPLAGMAIKAATKYTDKKALGRMQEMLSTGVGPTGQPLTPEEKKSLTEAQKSLSEEKPSVGGGLGGLLGGLIEKAISPKKEEKPQEKKQAEKSSGGEKAGASKEGGSKGSSSSSSSGNGARGGDRTGGRSMAKGGLVTRRK